MKEFMNSTALKSASSSAPRLRGTTSNLPAVELPPRGSTLKLDFHNARLETVLNYLRESAGLIIHARSNVQMEPTVDLCHEHPVSPHDALVLLKEVLVEKGWMLFQRGPLFNIISQRDLKKNCIPLPSI